MMTGVCLMFIFTYCLKLTDGDSSLLTYNCLGIMSYNSLPALNHIFRDTCFHVIGNLVLSHFLVDSYKNQENTPKLKKAVGYRTTNI